MIKEAILLLFVFATSIPVAKLLAWLCEDELKNDRKYFFMLGLFLAFSALILFFVYFKPSIIFSLCYMILVLALMIKKVVKPEKKNKKKK
jgi:hypothetical protein